MPVVANPFQYIPSLEQMLQRADMAGPISLYGRVFVRDCLRRATQALREELAGAPPDGADGAADAVAERLMQLVQTAIVLETQGGYRPVFNLTGTVLHTNLGRAVLPESAIRAVVNVAGQAAAIEFDLQKGGRGERDDPVEALLRQLTGAEAATVVNNNAAAVMLCLNSLAAGREVIVSRGELVEIGGAFRMPDIMASSGCRLCEVGTTNRTHLADYANGITADTAALMTVHPSNYEIRGFTSRAGSREIAALAREHSLPLIDDLGSGSLVSLKQFGLPHEPTVRESLEAGADVVTFSGDKLLGGPQCGLIVGRADLIDRIRHNPMKRALRVGKMTLAALDATLRLYLRPDKLAASLPGLRHLTRDPEDLKACAGQICDSLSKRFNALAEFGVISCHSQIGSGALPVDLLSGFAVAITPRVKASTLTQWTDALRRLPVPVLGRIHAGCLLLDVRTLEDSDAFIKQLDELPALLELH